MQATVVQRSIRRVSSTLGRVERSVMDFLTLRYRRWQRAKRRAVRSALGFMNELLSSLAPKADGSLPDGADRQSMETPAAEPPIVIATDIVPEDLTQLVEQNGRMKRRVKLGASVRSMVRGRYGSKFDSEDALDEFLFDNTSTTVASDGSMTSYQELDDDMELIERLAIRDVLLNENRSRLGDLVPKVAGVLDMPPSLHYLISFNFVNKISHFMQIFSVNELIEPSFGELIVMWLPLPPPPPPTYNYAITPLWRRFCTSIDHMLPDEWSDNAFRSFFAYRNALTRYDLLVNRFVTSKLTARGVGVVEYVAREAGIQSARRAEFALAQMRKTEASSAPTLPLAAQDSVDSGMPFAGVDDPFASSEQLLKAAAQDDLLRLGLIWEPDREEGGGGGFETKRLEDMQLALQDHWRRILGAA
ncbi:MAG: hypothetical protein SGPRY_000076 [Prymnesium sp.]